MLLHPNLSGAPTIDPLRSFTPDPDGLRALCLRYLKNNNGLLDFNPEEQRRLGVEGVTGPNRAAVLEALSWKPPPAPASEIERKIAERIAERIALVGGSFENLTQEFLSLEIEKAIASGVEVDVANSKAARADVVSSFAKGLAEERKHHGNKDAMEMSPLEWLDWKASWL